MERENIRADAYSYSSAIIACGRAGEPERALRLLDAMEDKHYRHSATQTSNPNEQSQRSSSRGSGGGAVGYAPPPPNLYVYRAALSVCVQAGMVEEARALLNRAKAAPYLLTKPRTTEGGRGWGGGRKNAAGQQHEEQEEEKLVSQVGLIE